MVVLDQMKDTKNIYQIRIFGAKFELLGGLGPKTDSLEKCLM